MAGRPYVFNESDPYQSTQGGIWKKRQAEYRFDIANYDSQIHGAEAQVAQQLSDVEKYEGRLKLAGDAEKVYQPLLEKGYVSKLQVMQASDTRTEMGRLLADAQNEVAQVPADCRVSKSAKRFIYTEMACGHGDAACGGSQRLGRYAPGVGKSSKNERPHLSRFS